MAGGIPREEDRVIMSSIVPEIFVVLSAAALFIALVAFWRSLKILLSDESWTVSDRGFRGDPGVGTLMFELERVEQNFEEIRSEREIGGLSERDFAELNGALRQREKELRDLLEQDYQSARRKAAKLIEERLARQTANTNASREAFREEARIASVQASSESEANSPLIPSGSTEGPKDSTTPDRGRWGDSNRIAPASVPVLHDELPAVVAKKHYPGERIPRICRGCGTVNDPDARFCKECGTKFDLEVEP
ncbi:MAG: zinc ribbon domain-containing protein [Deltaproteobacteria bacterium]|nr:zinc ribbon domain-containing protein [Deltaproteobacteria bacterium]